MEYTSIAFSGLGYEIQVRLGNVVIWCADLSKHGLHTKAWVYKSVDFTKQARVSQKRGGKYQYLSRT